MREKLALAIAALMITSMAFAISTTSVSATHATPTISLSPDFVKEGESYVFTLSVTNESGDPIDTVEITPSHLTNIESIVKLPKDNIVENANVALSDGTQVTVVSASVTVAENTVVSLPAGTLIVAPSGDDAELYEDGTAEMIASENSIATVSAVKAAADRLAAKQNPDGGFMWKLQVGGTSRTNVLGITAIGILKAHGLEDKDTYETALAKAYKYAVDKPPTYTWGGSKYTESTKGVDSFPDVTFLVWLAQAAANDDSLLAAIQGQVSGTTATDIAGLAKTRWDNRVLYLGSTQQTSPNGTATGMAEYIRDARHGQGWDTLIPWDLEAAVKAALALNAYYPGQGYDAQAADIADVIYASVDDENSIYFSSTDDTQEGYVLGLTGAIEAFEEVGLYPEKATELKTLLMDIQQPDGSWKYYGDTPVDNSVQDTAYAVMALVAAGEGDAARLGACWLIDSQLSNGGWYAEGGTVDEYLEVDSEAVQALVAQAPGPVPVTVEEQEVTLSENDLRLLADTLAAASLWLPEDTPAEVPDDVNTNVAGDMTLVADHTVTLPDDSAADVRLLANTLILYTSGPAKGIIAPLVAGAEVDLRGSEDVVLPAGTTVTGTALVTVAENEDVTIPAGTTVVLPTGTESVPMPEGWTPSVNKWSGTKDNIKAGETVEFPFAATVGGGSSWNITVKTTDVKGYQALVVITMTSDGTPPSVTATVSPELTNSSVTITVVASEKLSELGEVTVRQAGAAEENVFTIEMTSTNGITWTGTYAVIPDHDGIATVAIENSVDLVGNVGGENASVATFEVDTIAPDAPVAVLSPSNDGDVILLDNFVNQPNQWVYGVTTEAKVLVRVNAKTITTTPRTDNGFSVAITLAEGTNVVGVSLVDAAGNASKENVQEVVLDSLPPTVEVVSIAGEAYKADMAINDNTPTIVARMLDEVTGVKRENSSVKLDDNLLENANVWNPETGLFENTVHYELSEGPHTITITAVDNSGVNLTTTENFTFVVDVTAPTMPTLNAGNNPILHGTTALDPLVQRDTTLVFYGSDLEPSSTANIYLIDQATGSAIKTETTTVDATGNFSKSLTLAEGKVIRIEVETVDAAGNVSLRPIYGYVMADATAPSVTLGTLPETTDKTSITISGTVSKDTWEDWSNITLTVQVGTGRVIVPIGADGSYSYSLELAEGPNTIVVQASDSLGNASTAVSATVEQTVIPWMTYAIILVIVVLLMAVIAIFRK